MPPQFPTVSTLFTGSQSGGNNGEPGTEDAFDQL